MDFRAALVNNINANANSHMNPHFEPANSRGAIHITPPAGNHKAPGETPTRRRRRRRNNATKLAVDGLLKEDEEPILQEHTPPYTPLRGTFVELPTLQVLEASPVPSYPPVAAVSWPPTKCPERVPVETLHAIAERARERLAIRIQAYWEEKQKVAEAAARIQNAYTMHMESQLTTIVSAMQSHLSTSIDNKLDSFKQAWQEEISNTFNDFENNLSSQHPNSVDPKLVKAARISALEGETQKLMEMMASQKVDTTSSSGVSNGEMVAVLRQLQVQGERTDHSLKELFGISQRHSIETNELRDAMKSAGLLPHAAPPAPQKFKAHAEQPAKGRHLFTVYEGKENASSPAMGLSPMRSNQNVVVTSPHHL